ncbi:MAG: flavin reductase family protein [Gammaproteobacteria bacterium]|nr:flavin reductase family protein [Gammaproteobacteria bacterium]NNF49739.1 flavin reductase family protein [Woeseiaceae bacterium]MBT8094143.1 flavin reductase family protein [Gammaproteobacteria bacterium]MBT8106542.1 flavin reductase family protein [Gammaproteobacteria bacterium]NNK26557.1 flavin reductase family protein [Woeseiaceae bacterium]
MTLNGPDDFRKAYGCFATGVAVATTVGADGEPAGMTISSFNSVSLEPPLVLWSIAHDAKCFDAFMRADYFAIHVLGEKQQDLSGRFATRDNDKFVDLDWAQGLNGNPILPEFAACFECSTEHRYEGGDHVIIVGRVRRFEDRELDPLIFYRGAYHGKRSPTS